MNVPVDEAKLLIFIFKNVLNDEETRGLKSVENARIHKGAGFSEKPGVLNCDEYDAVKIFRLMKSVL